MGIIVLLASAVVVLLACAQSSSLRWPPSPLTGAAASAAISTPMTGSGTPTAYTRSAAPAAHRPPTGYHPHRPARSTAPAARPAAAVWAATTAAIPAVRPAAPARVHPVVRVPAPVQAAACAGCSVKDFYTVKIPKATPHNVPPYGLSTAPAAAARHLRCQNARLRHPVLCTFGLAAAAPRSPYRHLELCGIALRKMQGPMSASTRKSRMEQ